METKNLNNMNETIAQEIKLSSKRFNDLTSSMSELYKNQFNEAMDFSGKLFNSVLENNKKVWDSANHFTNLFSKDQKGNTNSNPFFSFYEDAVKQITSYNQNLSELFLKSSNFNSVDWKEISEKFQRTTEQQIESAKETTLRLMERYNKRTELSLETIKDVQTEFYKQVKTIVEFNQKLMADTLNNKASFVEDFLEKPLTVNHSSSEKKQAKTAAI